MSRGFDLTIYDFDDETPLIGSGSTFSDDPSHPRPYLLEVTNFAAQEIDFPAGASTIGAVTVSVLDKRQDPTDQNSGILTAYISEIIGRRARLRRLRGSTWFTVFDGVVNGYEVDEESIVTYNLFLRDGRDRERAADLFTRNGTFVVYGANGKTGPAEPYGILPSGDALIQPVGPNTNAFSLASDPDPADGIYYGFLPFEFIRKGSIGPDGYVAEPIALDELDMPERAEEAWEYRDVSVRWRPASGGDWTYLDNMPRAWNRSIMDPNQTANVGASRPAIYVGSYDLSELPANGQNVQWQVLAQRTSESTPFFWDRGTFGDLLREIYDGEYTRVNPRIRYNAEALDDFAYETPTARFIAYEPVPNMREWVQEHIYAPMGYAPSFDPDMRITPIAWKLPDNEEDLPILDADNVVPAGNWSHDLDSVINAVEITFIRELNRAPDVAPARERPSLKRRLQKWIFGYPYDKPEESTVELEEWEKLAEVEVVRRRINAGSAAILGTREIKYKPITVRSIGDSAGLPIGGGTVDEIGDEIARDLAFSILNRFPFGSVRYVADVLATSEQIQELQIGQWVKVRPDWMPDYQVGRRGARRIMQVVGITDERENYRTVHLMDGAADEDTLPGYCPIGCIIPEGAETVIYGDYIYHIFTQNGSFSTLADSDADEEYDVCEVDILAVGQGGPGGTAAPDAAFSLASSSIVYVDEDGEEIPTNLSIPSIISAGGIVARAGGRGGQGGFTSGGAGTNGASGGGGGSGSAAFNISFGLAGGNGRPIDPAKGNPGGPAWGSYAIFYRYSAAGGSGGSAAGPGINQFGTKIYAGGAGSAPDQSIWPGLYVGPGGNSGSAGPFTLPPPLQVPIRIGGGGGQGGTEAVYTRPIKPNRTIQVRVNEGPVGDVPLGGGGHGLVFDRGGVFQEATRGGPGIVIVREPLPIEEGPATIVGGTTSGGIQTVVFNSDDELEVTSAGWVDATVVGGGGGGGSGAGGGGGGGGVLQQRITLPVGKFPVQVGAGGAGGTSGSAGADGGSSRIEDTVARGGGGGGGANNTNGRNGGSGGGGAGFDGSAGRPSALQGNQGGEGGGFDTTKWGGGGGGGAEPGDDGARTEGNPIAVNYTAMIGTPTVDYDAGELRANNENFAFRVAPSQIPSGEVAVQVISRGTAQPWIGLRYANIAFQLGYVFKPRGAGFQPAGIYKNGTGTPNLLLSFGTANPSTTESYPSQFYSGPSVQEAWSPVASGATADNEWDLRDDGLIRLEGRNTSTTFVRFGEFMVFKTKYLTVSGLPSGWTARVQNNGANTVSSAVESSGVAKIDLFQVGANAATEIVPTAGWPTLQILDTSNVIRRTLFGGFYPGDEFVYDGTDLDYDEDANGDPKRGMLLYENWKGTRPGPRTGDGGDGRLIGGTRYGAGGGGGSEFNDGPAGVGGLGGGGNGSIVAGTPGGNGTANTGGGGGGSRATTDAGGNGGSGVVIVQVPV